MPDWGEIVGRRLARLALKAAEKDDVHAEVAAHLEESYEAFCKEGWPEREAVHRTFEEVGDWEDLRRRVVMAKTGGGRMHRRTKQLWVPGFLTLILSMIFLAIFQKLGFQLRFIGSGPGAVLFYGPWLLSLPFFGALGASVSFRSGGSRATALLASVFPTLALGAAFLLMFPIGMIVERATGHHNDFPIVATTLLRDGIGWLVAPGVALLAGGVLANVLFGRRPLSPPEAIG